MKRPSKINYQGSNRQGQPLTKQDLIKKQNAYNKAFTEYSSMTESELDQIHDNKYIFNGKKLSGANKEAFALVYFNLKNKKNEQTSEN